MAVDFTKATRTDLKKYFFFSDLGECQTGNDNCHLFAECTNTLGSFTCTCSAGFGGNGVNCSGVIKDHMIRAKYVKIVTGIALLVMMHLAKRFS